MSIPIITALPKSGCFRQRSIRKPATSACGKKPIEKERICSAFFESE